MQTVKASEFKGRCLARMAEMARRGSDRPLIPGDFAAETRT